MSNISQSTMISTVEAAPFVSRLCVKICRRTIKLNSHVRVHAWKIRNSVNRGETERRKSFMKKEKPKC